MIDSARQKVAVTVNSELTILYWNIGKQINEDILKNNRAGYGKYIIAELIKNLLEVYGSGFSKKNLHLFVKFNELYPDIQIVYSLSTQLSWTHFRNLIPVSEYLTHLPDKKLLQQKLEKTIVLAENSIKNK